MSSRSHLRRLRNLGAILGAVAAILGAIDEVFKLGMWRSIAAKVRGEFELPWPETLFVTGATAVAALLLPWIWGIDLAGALRRKYQEERSGFYLRFGATLVIVISVSFMIVKVMSPEFPVDETVALFPQTANFGPTIIQTYATNGKINYTFHDETPFFGPRGYAEITMRVYGQSNEENCGWVIYLLRGIDVSAYRELRFMLRGNQGNELIGVKAKDVRGTEIAIPLTGDYLREGRVAASWQQVTVPLDHFGDVDFSVLDNFSIFATGTMIGTRPQVIDVGGFELL